MTIALNTGSLRQQAAGFGSSAAGESPNGTPTGALRRVGTNTDITACKQAELKVIEMNTHLEKRVEERTMALAASSAQLAKSERLFRSLVENINQGYFVADRRSQVTYFNPAAAAVLGVLGHNLLGKSVFRLVANEDRARVIAAYRAWVREGAQDVTIEFRLPIKSGRVAWVEHATTILRDPTGAVVEFHNNVRDITERKAAELLLLQSKDRFHAVFDRSPVIIALLSVPEGRMVEFNLAAVTAFGFNREDTVGRTSLELNLWERPADCERYLTLLKSQGHVEGFEARMRRKNGEVFTVLYNGSLIQIAGQTYSLNSLQDVSARRQAESALRASEERLTHALEATSDGVWDWSIATGNVYFSPQWCRLLGFEQTEVSPRAEFFFGLVHPEDVHTVRLELDAHLAGRKPSKESEARLRTKSGEYRWFLDRGKIVARDAAGQPLRMVGTITDITERRRLQQSLRLTQFSLDRFADSVFWLSPDATIQFVNEAACRSLGYTREELIGMKLAQLNPKLTPETWQAHWAALKRDHAFSFEGEHRTKDGRFIATEVSVSYIQFEGQEYNCAIMRDTGERRQNQLALEQAHRRTSVLAQLGRELAEAATPRQATLAIIESARQLLDWDCCWMDYWNEQQQVFVDPVNFDLVDGVRSEMGTEIKYPRTPTPLMRRIMKEGPLLILRENENEQLDGHQRSGTSRRSLSLMFAPVRRAGRVLGIVSIQSYRRHAYDSAALELLQTLADHCSGALVRIQERAELDATTERFRLVWETAKDGMRLTDASGKVIAVNDAYCGLMGKPRSEIEDRMLSDVYAESNRAHIIARHCERFARREVPPHREQKVELWDGRTRWFDVTTCFIETDPGHPLLLGIFRCIAERKRSEFEREQLAAKLAQSQKFEALGTLAGGVAHDFNNILSPVINYTELALEECPPDRPQIGRYLGEVLKSTKRAKELVSQIMLFTRSEDAARDPINLAQVVAEALSLMRPTLPPNIELKIELDRGAQRIIGNAAQIHRVVVNLVGNAKHAMQPQGGSLTVRLRQRAIGAALASELPDLSPGIHACLEISDTGIGMTPVVLARIFEPFFTTKKTGEGTGLGLAVVHSIVRSHDGAIRVSSEPGEGTTLELYFPVPAATTPTASATNRELPRGQGQHLLLVDDEAPIVLSLKIRLERLGYRVSIHTEPERAWETFAALPSDFDAVITDLQMPGMSGLDLARKILARRATLPVFVTTGFAGKHSPESLRAEGIRGIFEKPVGVEEIAEVLAKTTW